MHISLTERIIAQVKIMLITFLFQIYRRYEVYMSQVEIIPLCLNCEMFQAKTLQVRVLVDDKSAGSLNKSQES